VFSGPLSGFWSAIFDQLAVWTHIAGIAAMGNATLFPPTPFNLLWRWLVLLPLASLVACFFELVNPRTPPPAKRVLTPEEHDRVSMTHVKEEQGIAAPRKKKATKPRSQKVDTPAPESSAPQSIWGQIDWQQADEGLKKAAIQEKERRDLATYNEELAQWVAEQQKIMDQGGLPQMPKKPKPVHSSHEPSSPAPKPSHRPDDKAARQQKKEQYNWNRGEGKLDDL
jgi:hypothetical protein